MRTNLPIHAEEIIVPENQYLISKTNQQGKIYYTNPIFEEISGFAHHELVGADHNIVRHPHMPPSVFKDMWQTLQALRPWEGVIKNRHKNGNFYWVYARVLPIIENGKHTGYASVRVRATPEQIAAAETRNQRFINDPTSDLPAQQGAQPLSVHLSAGCSTLLSLLFSSNYSAHFTRLALLSLLMLVATVYTVLSPSGLFSLPNAISATLLGSLMLFISGYGASIAKRLLNNMKRSTHIAQQIATGNLRVHTSSFHAPKESRQLHFYLDFMRKSLAGIALNTQQGAAVSITVAQALQANNQQLSQRTAEQFQALENTAASMQQLSHIVSANADNTAEATRLAQSSMNTAEQGGKAVQDMVDTMQAIHQSSRQIAEITTLIEGIAFQTNILALNASVESARAGEAGRGFAVVAAEVRNLALRSSSAAGEIKELLQTAVGRINIGVSQAEQAGQTMQHIVSAVERVTQTIADIANSSSEQTHGLTQIQVAVEQLEQLSRLNSDLVEQLGDTVTHLHEEALELDNAIGILAT